jgi:hypothetical protein
MENTTVERSVDIQSDKPWSSWPQPKTVEVALRDLVVENKSGSLVLKSSEIENEIKIADQQALQQLGWNVGFPADFVSKLDSDLAKEVINSRILSAASDAKNRKLNFITEGDEEQELKAITSTRRSAISHRVAAQAFFDAFSEKFEEATVDYTYINGRSTVRLLAGVQSEITSGVGDIISHGAELNHVYGNELELSTYANRLVCLNGAYSPVGKASHRSASEVTIDAQIDWIFNTISEIDKIFEDNINRSREMAATTFTGSWREALRTRMKAMGVPSRFYNEVYEAFEQEPGQTEWHLYNAVTRAATHSEKIDRSNGRRIQSLAGSYVHGFELVTAKVPGIVAKAGGFELV